ncbi:MAG TPA: lysylphosphatidylglycerol synthase transmembrane domain-containing protein [Actinospica sp.]|nr:lysylphosphatidylglycerol synthase transmembrane domain-containing protein [Actinospica sp.]
MPLSDPRSSGAAAPTTAAPAAPPSPAAHAPSRHRALSLVLRTIESRLFKLGFVLAIVALGAYAVVHQWSDFRSGLDRLGAMAAFEALICVIAALLLTMQAWRSLLAADGSRLPVRAAARIFFIGQLGKYVPGSVWPVLTQMELGRIYRVPRQRSATVAMLAMLIGLTAGLLATVIGLPFMAGDSAQHYWWVFLFIPVTLAFLHPKVLNPVIARGLRLIRKPAPESPLTGRAITQAIALFLGAWLCYGLQIWVMTARLGVHGGDTLLAAIGAFALAWCVGFLIVLAPAGSGVREVILVATLAPLLHSDRGAAVAIALVSRGVTILADLILAGGAGLLGRGDTLEPEASADADANSGAEHAETSAG